MIRCSLHTSILHYSACSCPMAAYWYNFRTWITYAMRMMYAMWRNHGSREGPREPRRASWRSRGSRRRSRRRRWPVNKRYATRSSSSSYNHPGYILETVRTPLFFPSPFTPPCQAPPHHHHPGCVRSMYDAHCFPLLRQQFASCESRYSCL